MTEQTAAIIGAIIEPLITGANYLLSEQGEKDIQTAREILKGMEGHEITLDEAVQILTSKLIQQYGWSEQRAEIVTAFVLEV